MVYLAVVLKSPHAAEKLLGEFENAIERIAELPNSGQSLSYNELEKRGYHRILVARYWVYYRFTEDTLTIYRILHTNQDIDSFGFEIFDD